MVTGMVNENIDLMIYVLLGQKFARKLAVNVYGDTAIPYKRLRKCSPLVHNNNVAYIVLKRADRTM